MAELLSNVTKEENARLSEENQHLLAVIEERNAELAIIQSVQEGLASRLTVQAIYDLVGDKIRDIFHAQGAAIYLFDHTTEILETPYCFLKKRFEIESRPFAEHPIAKLMVRTMQPIIYRNVEEYRAMGGAVLENSQEYKSGMYVPLMVGKEIKGMVGIANLDKESAYDDSDLRLLQTLANSLSVALENARLFDETEQRAAELAIINTVQEGLASKLDMQSIYDLVGDKIREIFHNTDAEIRIYDSKTNLIHFPYFTDNGKRLVVDPMPLTDLGISSYVLRTGKTVVINENLMQEIEKYGSKILPGGHPAKSVVFVPLVVSNQARGLIALGNVEREHAFSESDVRLLQTLANSMSTALENARLFDETQNLLKETEQRAAELQIINSVQEGLASKLDMQAIYDLVGDKIRDLFNAQSVWIQIYDQATRTRHFRYGFYRRRLYIPEALPFNKLTEHLIATKKPLVINQDADARKAEFEMVIVAGSEMFKSAVFVPLIAGGDVKGTITLQNMEQENVFSESDISLLSTLASSMSVALENARLFDETQRLLNETEQRNAELAIINSVQAELAEGLASKRDMQDIYDLVGDKIRELFPNTDTEIRIYDPKTNLFYVPYYIENGQRVVVDPISPSDATISAQVLRTGQTVVINENIFQEMEKYGAKMMRGRRIPAKSVIFVPLMVGNQARGLIVLNHVEREHAFSQSDVLLFQTLANSMSTALENVRLFDEVQKKNAEITEALERETASNDILRTIAESPTDIQPVLQVIARNAARLSGSDDAIITLRDGDMLRVDAHYGDVPTFPAGEGMRFNGDSVAGRVILEGRPLQAIHNQHGVKSEYPEGDKVAKKYGYRMTCAVPLMREGKAIGAISIRRIKPKLLTEKHITLIQSFANQAAIAVENVRLFNETTRLLKETEQRAAELAIINSVQEGLSSKLDMQAIYELVGDKMQEIFDAQSLLIVTFDHVNEMAHVTYNREMGIRYYADPYPFTGLHRYLIQSRNTVVINENSEEWQAKFGMVQLPGTASAKSMIFVPLTSGYRVSGLISLQNLEREHAFSDNDVRLLETLASSMSVALENASLFDDTQRLFVEAKEARTTAEQANQAKSTFLSSMSHELRTPLNAIINFVEMVARGMIGPVNQDQVELLDQALHSSKHLLNLINDVLDISKIQAGQLTLFIEDQVSVHVEVEATLSIVGGLLQEKGLQLVRDIDPHLPMVSCDRRRVRQVLLNLISNAIKFTHKGTITVSVKNQGQDVLFAVIDTGPGISPEKQDLIFEPFIQAENGEKQVHGTGLGLPISRSLVRAHGGELWVDSQNGEGSAFFFTLPVNGRNMP